MRARLWFGAALAALSLAAQAQIGGPMMGGGSGGFITPSSGNGTWATGQLLGPDGTAALPPYSFFNQPNTGVYHRAANTVSFSSNGTGQFELNTTNLNMVSGVSLNWLSGSITTSPDLTIARDGAADTFAQKRGANAQTRRLYFSTTGPVYWQEAARTAGVLYTAVGGAAQLSFAQPSVPTITTNGGTAPSCVGTDTAMTCTEGTAPPAAATFTVTFSGTWPAAPACIAMRGTTGASPLVQGVVTSTTTVVVNLSANLVASEKFHIQCTGVS